MPRVENTVMLEDVRLIFRNFEGRPGKFNKPGDRNFGVIIPEVDKAHAMASDGWNVKWLQPREDDEPGTEPTPWLPVAVDFVSYRPPRIVLITQPTDRRHDLHEDTVDQLDKVSIVHTDLIVRPFNWGDRNDPTAKYGVKAYLQTMFVTIEMDELEQKYENMAQQ